MEEWLDLFINRTIRKKELRLNSSQEIEEIEVEEIEKDLEDRKSLEESWLSMPDSLRELVFQGFEKKKEDNPIYIELGE